MSEVIRRTPKICEYLGISRREFNRHRLGGRLKAFKTSRHPKAPWLLLLEDAAQFLREFRDEFYRQSAPSVCGDEPPQ